jgi:hypothetical protein
LEVAGDRIEATQFQTLTSDGATACAPACADPADSVHLSADPSRAVERPRNTFAEALALIAALPLSDAERADAVRRLLAEREAGR